MGASGSARCGTCSYVQSNASAFIGGPAQDEPTSPGLHPPQHTVGHSGVMVIGKLPEPGAAEVSRGQYAGDGRDVSGSVMLCVDHVPMQS